MRISSSTQIYNNYYSKKPEEFKNQKSEGNKDDALSKVNEKEDIKTNKKPEDSPEVRAEVQKLIIREKEVIAHEQAHKSAAGQYAGAMSYSYTKGPDGRSYISGGEVSISAPSSDNPEEQIQISETVKNAALAPMNPSPQDHRVAAKASSDIQRARMELIKQKAEKAYGEDKDNFDLSKIIENLKPQIEMSA